jgi:hypothetical protein
MNEFFLVNKDNYEFFEMYNDSQIEMLLTAFEPAHQMMPSKFNAYLGLHNVYQLLQYIEIRQIMK